MNVFYEEDGGFKVGSILADNTASLQVEAPHGKRSKIKAANVMLRFAEPPLGEFMERAQRATDGIDLDFLWECCGTDEFGFEALGSEYFGHAPSAVEAAGLLIKLHSAPMYFYKKGKGRYKAAPEDSLKAALASVERKKRESEQMERWVTQLTSLKMPEDLMPHLNVLLYKPDRNTLECKALEQACKETGLSAPKLLEKCGAFASSHDFHFGAFLFENFPRGIEFEDVGSIPDPGTLPESDAVAFSIDDAATTEIDDAFSVRRMTNGNFRIGIHIAAPALSIEPGSSLDDIAAQRLSTVYMPGNKITMLPDLVVAHFTLAEDRMCPAVSMYLEVTPNYEVEAMHSRIDRVHIAANLRHDTLEKVFNEATLSQGGPDYPYKAELETLWQLSHRLEALRGKQDDGRSQPLDYNFLLENDRVTITERPRGSPIDKVVSELMIYVNSQWGRLLAEANVPGLYRCQSNGKVRMSTTPAPHQGLGVAQYAWSSSPLRRYVDLINQRQIAAVIRGEAAPYAHGSEALLVAMRDFELASEAYNTFQRNMERYWSLRYLLQEKVEKISATVLRENLVKLDGVPLVNRVSSLPDLNPGTRVELALTGVDLIDLNFALQFARKLDEEVM